MTFAPDCGTIDPTKRTRKGRCTMNLKEAFRYQNKIQRLMDEAEIREVISAVLAELDIEKPTAKDKGRIMKTLMPRVKGKADGGLVNQVLGSYFA